MSVGQKVSRYRRILRGRGGGGGSGGGGGGGGGEVKWDLHMTDLIATNHSDADDSREGCTSCQQGKRSQDADEF